MNNKIIKINVNNKKKKLTIQQKLLEEIQYISNKENTTIVYVQITNFNFVQTGGTSRTSNYNFI